MTHKIICQVRILLLKRQSNFIKKSIKRTYLFISRYRDLKLNDLKIHN